MDRHNVRDNDLETLVDATVFSKTVLGHTGPAQSVTSCEPPAVVHRAYHLIQDIMVKLTSDDHLDNLIKVLLSVLKSSIISSGSSLSSQPKSKISKLSLSSSR